MTWIHRCLPLGIAGIVLCGLPSVPDGVGGLSSGRALAQEVAQSDAGPGERAGRRRRAKRSSRGEAAEKSSALPPGMQQAVPVVTFGDWNVFTHGEGRSRLCYAIAQPQARTPKSLARDTGYLFVTVRKGDPQNEIAVMFGFAPKPPVSQNKPGAAAANADPYISVGNTRYGLVVKDKNAWVQNQAEEPKILTEMGKVQTVSIRTTSLRGNATSDDYALGGFADALKRAREECK